MKSKHICKENECAVISMIHVLHVDSEISDSYKIRHGQIVGFKVLNSKEFFYYVECSISLLKSKYYSEFLLISASGLLDFFLVF
jgi:hypothetical protein